MSSIGIVKDKDRRAGKQEDPFVGLSRTNVQDRFASIESTPTAGVTVPSDSSPPLWTSADRRPATLQEIDQESERIRQRNQEEDIRARDQESDKVRLQEVDQEQEKRIRQRNQETDQESDDEALKRTMAKRALQDQDDDSSDTDTNEDTTRRKQEQRRS